jgi:peptidoglycan/xylan/chitin deacetylase (PgdA/CDA1 family)
MGKSPLIRPQSILVLLLAAVVAWGADSATSGRRADPVSPTSEPREVAAAPTAAPATTTPAQASRPTRAAVPTATSEPEPTAVPATEEPAPAQRPEPPDTGLDGTSMIVERGESGRREVAFTFDAGEGAGHTEDILDLLDEYGVLGSFGVTGEWVEQNPELTRRIVDDGHMLINHTYDHQSWTGETTGGEPLGVDERRAQVEETERIIREVAGYEVAPYFRFPYGAYDSAALDLLGGMGYDYTLWWSCDTEGWNGLGPDEIVTKCGSDAEEGGPGAVILMHVADDNDFAALPPLLDDYAAADYDFVTMEQLIQP